MLRRLLGTWRLLRVVLHGLHGLVVVRGQFPSLALSAKQARVQWWSLGLLRCLGVRLQVQGAFAPGAKLVVANHISWLDIMAMHALHPQARFVSKADVRHWPVVGRLVDAGGTLYIERESRRDAMRVVHQTAQALREGDTVAVFPEGTTADGRATLPFHANLLQAAIATEAPVQPVALAYADAAHAISPAALFLGDTTVLQSLWALACARGVVVNLQILPLVPTAGLERRGLALQLRAQIETALGRDSADATPAASAPSAHASASGQATPLQHIDSTSRAAAHNPGPP